MLIAFRLSLFWLSSSGDFGWRIRLLMSLALKGVKYREVPAGKLLSRNLLIYGLGGLAAPFIFVKLIDMLLVLFGLA